MGRSLHIIVLALAVVAYGLLKAAPGAFRQDPEDAAVQQLQLELDAEVERGAVGRLATALSFATLANSSAPNHIGNPAPFQQLHDFLERSFPLVYERLKHERVSEYSILFTWQGSNPELRPVLAMSHMDVVPAPEGPGYNWTHPPFSGTVADGYIWGRGALDVKVTVLQQLEAVAALLRQGYAPQRTILLAFGHDEEVGGGSGAGAMAALLASRGVELELVLDEGGIVLMDGVSGPNFKLVERPVALIGTAEKGIEDWEIRVAGVGGHSSMPPTDGSSVAARISRVLAAMDAYPTPTKLGAPVTDWLQALAPAVKLAPLRMLLQNANNWIVNPVLGQLLGQAGKEINPFVRTTCGVVQIEAGGIAHNVLPRSGSIKVNCRLLPGHDSSFVQEYLEMVTRKEAAHVTLHKLPLGSVPASHVAASSGPHWQLIKQAILETLQPPGGLQVAPYLVSGMTDSRHYSSLAGGRVYRFCPHRYTRADIGRVHGVDERIAAEDFLRGIGYYRRILQLASADESSTEAGPEGAAATA